MKYTGITPDEDADADDAAASDDGEERVRFAFVSRSAQPELSARRFPSQGISTRSYRRGGFDFLVERNKTVVIAVFLLYSTPGRTKSQSVSWVLLFHFQHRTSFRPSFITSFDMQIRVDFDLK